MKERTRRENPAPDEPRPDRIQSTRFQRVFGGGGDSRPVPVTGSAEENIPLTTSAQENPSYDERTMEHVDNDGQRSGNLSNRTTAETDENSPENQ